MDTLSSPSTPPLHRKRSALASPSPCSAASTSLRKKFDQVDVIARAQRNTPELSDLDGISLSLLEDSPDAENELDDENVRSIRSISRTPSLRRLRIRTLERQNSYSQNMLDSHDSASKERMKRNTDSMIEDAVIAKQLKRRLGARWEQRSKQTVTNTELSDFLMKSILEEKSLDAVAAATCTSESRSNAADIAVKSLMEGYFATVDDKKTTHRVKKLFMESLQRNEFRLDDLICHQGDEGDKLYVIEEGSVQFLIGDHVAGTADAGNVFGEISLVYGIPEVAAVKAITQCAIIWTLDSLSFRQIQAIVANESLRESNLKASKSIFLKEFRKRASTLTDEQESSHRLTHSIDFQRLRKNSIIGRGTFGSVYLVSYRSKQGKGERLYGMKSMSKESIVKRQNEKRVLIERNALQTMVDCPFIMTLIGTHQDQHSIYFISEFVQGGNLMTYMIQSNTLTHSECIFFGANLASALVHVHSKGFIHRDIKPENCLIANDGYLKLCDFGMAKRLPSTIHLPSGEVEVVTLAFTMCGTPEFMAPEFVLSKGYDKGVDWWALGCILIEMYSGRAPFDFDGDLKKTFREVCLIGMGKKNVHLPSVLDKNGLDGARKFARDLITMSANRLGKDDSSAVLSHTYFDAIDFKDLCLKSITSPYIPKIMHSKDTSHFKKETETKEQPRSYICEDETWCKNF